VCGIDSNKNSIDVAKNHLMTYEGKEKIKLESNLQYFNGSIDDYNNKHKENNETKNDIVTAMEVIEHVVNPSDFISDINKSMNEGGLLFLSTVNKTWFSYLGAIVCRLIYYIIYNCYNNK